MGNPEGSCQTGLETKLHASARLKLSSALLAGSIGTGFPLPAIGI